MEKQRNPLADGSEKNARFAIEVTTTG